MGKIQIFQCLYPDTEGMIHCATESSVFKHKRDGSESYYFIDGNEVEYSTYQLIHERATFASEKYQEQLKFSMPIQTVKPEPIKIVFKGESSNTEPALYFHNGNSISVDGDITSIAERIYKELYEPPAWKANNPALKNIKENENMPKIVDYTYIEHDKVTKIKWSDGSTTVVCGSGDDATQFCGYVCAIAKKAMGNNGKMLAEWDRLVVKPVERAKKAEEKKRLAAEKKAEEERIREEAKAKRMAKNAKYYEEREKRRKQREVETLAEQIAKEYEQDKLYAEAMKLAIEKYKVPCNYFADDCDCHCNCKEFDVMDEDENNISD